MGSGNPRVSSTKGPVLRGELCGLSLTALACGDSHTLALTASGVVMCCGSNESGQLGLGHSEPEVSNPTANSMTGVTSVTGGSFHSFFVKIPEVWACGNKKLGQLGLAGGSIVTPMRVESLDAGYRSSSVWGNAELVPDKGRLGLAYEGDGMAAGPTT